MNINTKFVPNYYNPGNQNQQQYAKQYPQGYKNYNNQYQNQYQNQNYIINTNNNYNNYRNFSQIKPYSMTNEKPDETAINQSLKYVSEKYPQLKNINQTSSGITAGVKNQANPRFFVIKSFTEEDIHKVRN